MNLSNLTENELITKTKFISNEEKRLTAELLHYLAEIERRRIYLNMGFRSMFELVVKYLGYAESSAWRRIEAMRLLKQVPSIEEKIKEGRLTLTNASAISTFLRAEKKENKKEYTIKEKEMLLNRVEGKSKREVERLIVSLSPIKELPKEKEKPLTSTKTQIQFNADVKLLNKLKTIKEKLGCQVFNMSYEELINKMADITLDKIERDESRREKGHRPEGHGPKHLEEVKKNSLPPAEVNNSSILPTVKIEKPSRYIPVSVKHEVLKRDQYQCTFVSLITGKRCDAKTSLEFDHKKPFSLGGAGTVENIRVLCKNHNLLEASMILGENVMKPYLKV